MSRIIDLTLPIADHFCWKMERRLVADHAHGSQFQVTWAGWSVHGFTHVDAPCHLLAEGITTSNFNLDQLIGRAAVIDLTSLKPNEPITVARISAAADHVAVGDIALLKTCWELRHPPTSPAFWRTSPWLTREACDWLRTRGIKALGVDFPQDEGIRHLLDGIVKPITDYPSHDALLRHGVLLVEYLCNLVALTRPHTQLYVLPLKIPDADGAPVRAIAIEE